MISQLSGTAELIEDDVVVVQVKGVGYEVHCDSTTIAALHLGEAYRLWVETVVREDSIRLYGFLNIEDRRLYRALTGVQGVGARSALAILALADAAHVSSAVLSGDSTFLSQANGVGPKIAKRICAELRDRLVAITNFASMTPRALPAAAAAENTAIEGLIGLGYRADAARRAVLEVDLSALEQSAGGELTEKKTVSWLIKEALKSLDVTS